MKDLVQKTGFKIATSGGFLLFTSLTILGMSEDMGLSGFIIDFASFGRWLGAIAACFGLGLLYSARNKKQ